MFVKHVIPNGSILSNQLKSRQDAINISKSRVSKISSPRHTVCMDLRQIRNKRKTQHIIFVLLLRQSLSEKRLYLLQHLAIISYFLQCLFNLSKNSRNISDIYKFIKICNCLIFNSKFNTRYKVVTDRKYCFLSDIALVVSYTHGSLCAMYTFYS